MTASFKVCHKFFQKQWMGKQFRKDPDTLEKRSIKSRVPGAAYATDSKGVKGNERLVIFKRTDISLSHSLSPQPF